VNLPLSTCNPSDFEAVRDLELRPVPHPDRAR
jgi:predicted nucleic acid-binding protein